MPEHDFRSAASHYDYAYFKSQSSSGAIGARLDRKSFEEFVEDTDTVIDFGCGGGFLLNELKPGRRIGIEINPHGRAYAKETGIEVYETTDDLPADLIADAIISNHALEHVEEPLRELRKLAVKLKLGGLLVLVVPCDVTQFPFEENDPDFHLYSWSANNIGNLARCAGFRVLEASEIRTRWPPKWAWIYKHFGFEVLRITTYIWGVLPAWRRQVRLVAIRQAAP